MKATTFKEWAGSRTSIPFPYGRSGHTVGVRRGTLLLVVILLLAAMATVNWWVEEVLHSSPTAPLGGVATLAVGSLISLVLVTLVYAIEIAPLKRQGVRFLDVGADNDDYLRYVHPAIAATGEWETITEAARKHPPPSGKASGIHSLLWEAAGIKPTLDAGEILPVNSSHLSEIALLARGL